MTNFKGTKGKWSVSDKVKENEHGAYYVEIDCIKNGSGVIGLAVVYEGTTEHFLEEMHANAKLISKAPEMLELLQAFILAVPNYGTYNYQACMDKARGLVKEVKELPNQTNPDQARN